MAVPTFRRRPWTLRKDGIDEFRKHGARHPESAAGDQGQRAGKLVAGFGVGQQALGAQAQQVMAVRGAEFFGNHEQARGGRCFQDIGDQRRSGGLRGVCASTT